MRLSFTHTRRSHTTHARIRNNDGGSRYRQPRAMQRNSSLSSSSSSSSSSFAFIYLFFLTSFCFRFLFSSAFVNTALGVAGGGGTDLLGSSARLRLARGGREASLHFLRLLRYKPIDRTTCFLPFLVSLAHSPSSLSRRARININSYVPLEAPSFVQA
jgi:hypothetical protein